MKTGWKSTQSCLWIGVAVFVIVVGGWTLEKEPEQKSVMAQRGDSGASITIAKEQTLSRESWQAGAAPVLLNFAVSRTGQGETFRPLNLPEVGTLRHALHGEILVHHARS